MKKALLINTQTDCKENQISWNWFDWNYIGENYKNKKQSMKTSVALHFARTMCVEDNPLTKHLNAIDKLKVKKHSLIMIPSSWQSYVSKELN